MAALRSMPHSSSIWQVIFSTISSSFSVSASAFVTSLSVLFHFNLFRRMSLFSRILIVVGCFIMTGLSLLFYMLLRRGEILYRLCDRVMEMLGSESS